jgi:hypothetical protein
MDGVVREAFVDRVDERLGVVGDGDDAALAVGVDDVGDRRRHHRKARREVFERLGRADVPRRPVLRERHDRDVPAGEVPRQIAIVLHAERMHVGARRHPVG